MSKTEEFDTSDLAWMVYKMIYPLKGKIVDGKRKYIIQKENDFKLKISGETDFNFGPGWSNTIFNKYKNYLNESQKADKNMYLNRLEICKGLYKSILNISLMPQTGNLQSVKKGIGNDRIDTYIWALNNYYEGESSLIFNYTTFQNEDYLKKYLDSFKNKEQKPIYVYCNDIYHINPELVNKLIESGKKAIDSDERVIKYMDLAYEFWSQKSKYIYDKKNKKNMKSIIGNDKINEELNKCEEMLNDWNNI